MRKLYRKSTVHPSPLSASSDHLDLAFLPAAIFTLTVALSPEDKEVLAYLLSCCSNTNPSTTSSSCRRDCKGCPFSDHSILFSCSCFRCYMSYWIRWDSSPNRQLIHEIIDAFEDFLVEKTDEGSSSKKSRGRRRKGKSLRLTEFTRPEFDSVNEAQTRVGDVIYSIDHNGCENDEDGVFSDDGLEFDKGSMKKFVSFIGERIWGVLAGKEKSDDEN